MNLIDNIKGIPNTSIVPSFKMSSTDNTSLLVNLVVLEFIIRQGVVLLIVESNSLFRGILRRGPTIRIA
jgi:hypothetical protein